LPGARSGGRGHDDLWMMICQRVGSGSPNFAMNKTRKRDKNCGEKGKKMKFLLHA
jgi:hypothetical protein